MTRAPRSLACLAATLTIAGASLLSGCGADDGIGKRYQVGGTVTYNGAPLRTGQISFIPEDEKVGRPAAATIKDGAYKVSTQSEGDGIKAGKYRINITAYEGDTTKAQEEVSKKGGNSVMVDQVTAGKAVKKSLIPKKYNATDTSGLSAEITGSNSSLNFDLKD